MDRCTDSVRKAAIFNKLDCSSGFWKIKTAKVDRNRKTLTLESGLFCVIQMHSGMKNDPMTFQRAVGII